ncbi:MAG TPA: tetratricopeptide repeat protein [Blastocatellia bacterium]|nr:tetratricopeptide repeat protein [Blastocatellia bacterium]
MKTERFGPLREQLRKARTLIDRAVQMAPTDPRVCYYAALLLRAEGKMTQAADEFARLAIAYPRDRELSRQLGQTLYRLGRISEARAAFEAVLAIDPLDAGAYQFLVPIYASEGRKTDADRAQALYLGWRDDPLADVIAGRFFAAQPQWADERIGSHAHTGDSPARLLLTGSVATPDH